MTKKFVIEFTVDDEDLKDWIDYQTNELVEIGVTDKLEWTAVDLIGSNWATGEEVMSLTVTRCEEVPHD